MNGGGGGGGGGGSGGAVTRTRGLEFLFAFHPKENSFCCCCSSYF